MDRVEQEGGVDDAAGQWPEAGEAVEGLGLGQGRDPSPLRLQPDKPGPGGGDPDRARPVGPDRGGYQAGGDGRGGTTARAAGSVGHAPWVPGRAEGGPLGERPLADLGRVGLADHDRPRLAQAPHDLGVALGGRAGPTTAEPGRVSGEVDVFLDRDRDAKERRPLALGDPAVRGLRLLQRLLGADHPERIQVALGGFGPSQRVLDQLARGHATRGQHPHLLDAARGRDRSGSAYRIPLPCSSFERTIGDQRVGWQP